jgi:PIN domain nuclease of toxin-antitoxin system
LAVINREPGGDLVERHLSERQCVASSVNMAEVVTRLSEAGGGDDQIRAIIANLQIETIAFDEASAFDAGLLRAQTRALGLSLGDRACLALAQGLRRPAVTADRVWVGSLPSVEIEVIR